MKSTTIEEARRLGLLPAGDTKPQRKVTMTPLAPAVKSYHTVLPYPPQSNHLYTISRGRKILSSKGRAYRQEVEVYRPIDAFAGRLTVTIQAYMPDRRRRDLSNILKALEDAMTNAGFWGDDSQIDDLRIIRAGVEKPGRVEVFIRET